MADLLSFACDVELQIYCLLVYATVRPQNSCWKGKRKSNCQQITLLQGYSTSWSLPYKTRCFWGVPSKKEKKNAFKERKFTIMDDHLNFSPWWPKVLICFLSYKEQAVRSPHHHENRTVQNLQRNIEMFSSFHFWAAKGVSMFVGIIFFVLGTETFQL